ncbi:MAG: hypothetical protein IKJ29_04685 [Akkermansia sp.]|nr:hypothetical protein [Akkermansia sp.]
MPPAVWAEGWFKDWLDNTSALAQELSHDWRHELPESGVLPSYFNVEYVSRMRERGGGSSISWQQYSLSLPLADPRRSGGENWMFSASFNADVTLLDKSGGLHIQNNDLYHVSLPVSVIVPRSNGNMVVVALSPSFDSDFDQREHSFHMNLLATYTVKKSETFSYSVGLSYAPYAAAWNVMPVFAFDWQMNDDWKMSLSGFCLSVMRDMGQGLSAGLFVQGEGGSWAVSTPEGTRLLRVRSLVAGFTVEYDFSKEGETKRVASLSLGSSLSTAVDVCKYNSDRDREESHHYQPGLYVSAGVDFRF